MHSKKIILVILIIILFLLLYRGCGHSSNVGKRNLENISASLKSDLNFIDKEPYYLVPFNATLILSLNLVSVLNEIDYSSLRNSSLYVDKLKAFYNQNPPFTLVFSDVNGSGIDTSSKAIFLVDVGNKPSDVYSASILKLKDSEKFESKIRNLKFKQNKSKYYTYLDIDKTSSVAWNNNFIIFISSDPTFDKGKILNQCFDLSIKKYFDKENNFLQNVKSSSADLNFWMDFTSYSKNQIHASGKPGELPKKLLEDNYISGDIDFDNGKIEAEFQFILNEILKSTISKSFIKNTDRSITGFMPNAKPSFIANLSVNIDQLFNFLLSDIDRKIEARNSLIPYGLVIEDFGKALTGDFLLTGFPNDTTTKTSVLFGAKIKDQSMFYNLLSIMEQLNQIELIDTGVYRMNTGTVPFYPMLATYKDRLQRLILLDEYAFVSLDKNIIDAILNKKNSNNIESEYLLPIINNSNFLSLYFNNGIPEIKQYSDQFSIRDFSINYDGDNLKLVMNLNNSKRSSLKQLLSLN